LKVRQAEAQNKQLELQLMKDRQDKEFQERSKLNDILVNLLLQQGQKR